MTDIGGKAPSPEAEERGPMPKQRVEGTRREERDVMGEGQQGVRYFL